MDTRIQQRIQARISELKSMGVPTDYIDKIVKSENPGQADEIELVDQNGNAGYSMNHAPSSLRISDHTSIAKAIVKELDLRDQDAKIRQAQLEKEELETAYREQTNDDISQLKAVTGALVESQFDVLRQHNEIIMGERDSLDPMTNARKLFEQLQASGNLKGDLAAALSPEYRALLEAKPEPKRELPAPASDEKTIDVTAIPPKPRGFFQRGGK
jgi:hypothetical protein